MFTTTCTNLHFYRAMNHMRQILILSCMWPAFVDPYLKQISQTTENAVINTNIQEVRDLCHQLAVRRADYKAGTSFFRDNYSKILRYDQQFVYQLISKEHRYIDSVDWKAAKVICGE
uniref:Uncharacterized protein n=1 Tax=Glossina austeni TaxID=7395 RepID=A0A1A9VPI4_GLOAU